MEGETMTVPSELVGAFRRSGLILDGKRMVDYADVIWLQTPEWFVDMRLLIERDSPPTAADVPAWFYQEKAFAGIATWDAPKITWQRLIDSHGRTTPDSSPLVWDDGVIIELGVTDLHGKETPFAEEWLRMTKDDVGCSVEHGEGHARIEVGRFAVEIADHRAAGGRFTATRFERRDSRWIEIGSVSA
jgi:hypothetical protein